MILNDPMLYKRDRTSYVASVASGSVITKYATLADAIVGLPSVGDVTITLLADTEESVTVPVSFAIITLNLAGKTLAGTLTNSGNLTIQDSVGGGAITASRPDSPTVFNNGGTLAITGGTITATGGMNAVLNYGGSLTISGGTITATYDVDAVLSYNGTLTITGGTFVAGSEAFEVICVEESTVQISGGTYSQATICNLEQADYLADGCTVADNGDGTYTVTGPAASVTMNSTNTKYATLTAALEKVPILSTATITLLSDTEENVTVPVGRNITLNLNGKTLAGSLTNNSTLTIQDSVGGGAITDALINNGSLTITGGTFSSDVSDYVADGYEAVPNGDGTYTVIGNLTV